MRVLLFLNNLVGWQLTSWLTAQGEQIAGLVMHPPARQKYGREIIESARVHVSSVFDASRLSDADTVESIRALRADMGISILFDYILQPSFFSVFPAGVINVHPAYLPYNRGQYPNVWSIVEGTPAGVTIHYIDSGIDTGDIIAQREVSVAATDTGETLYRRLELAAVELFKETWPTIRSGRVPRTPQSHLAGTYHRTGDVERMDEIDPERSYKAKELIDIIRARTFPPYAGAYFRDGNRKVYLRLNLSTEDSQSWP